MEKDKENVGEAYGTVEKGLAAAARPAAFSASIKWVVIPAVAYLLFVALARRR